MFVDYDQGLHRSLQWAGCIVAALAFLFSSIHIVMYACAAKGQVRVASWTIVILLLIPIDAVLSGLAVIVSKNAWHLSAIFSLLRDLYMSQVIIFFLELSLQWLGGSGVVVKSFSQSLQSPQHVWLTFFPRLKETQLGKASVMPYKPGVLFMSSTLCGVLQYGIVMFFFVVWTGLIEIALICLQPSFVVLVLKGVKNVLGIVQFVSLAIALYNLLLLQSEIFRNEHLKEAFSQMRVHQKFLVLKLVILLTGVQKFLFEDVWPHVAPHVIDFGSATVNSVIMGFDLEAVILCFELVVCSGLFLWAFPPGELDKLALGPSAAVWMHPVFPWKDLGSVVALAKQQKKTISRLKKSTTICPSEIGSIFDDFDVDKNGVVNHAEFKFLLQTTDHSEEAIEKMYSVTGANELEGITKEKFCEVVEKGGWRSTRSTAA